MRPRGRKRHFMVPMPVRNMPGGGSARGGSVAVRCRWTGGAPSRGRPPNGLEKDVPATAPYNISGTDRFVRWVASELGPDTCVNLMRQYRPEHRAGEYPELARGLTVDEWNQAVTWAREAGLSNLSG
jgi:hypothetical protein